MSLVLKRNPFIVPSFPVLKCEPPKGDQWVHEVKFDGYRLQLHKDGKEVVLLSKNGNFTDRFSEIAAAVCGVPVKSVILNCELTACGDGGTPDFRGLLFKREVPLCIWAFDILAQKRQGLARPQALRKASEAQ